MRVYYLTNAQFALSNIALRRIKISRFSDLNDPFELLAVDLSDKTHRKAFRTTKEQLNENKGLICFSKSWSNPLLWGHYAEKHTGICLGFDIPDKFLKPVIYAERPMKIRIDPKTGDLRFNESNMSRLLRTKFADWKYEDEMRLFVELDHDTIESGNYFYPFSDDFILREIILGPRCEIPINGVRSLIENFNLPARVTKSRIAFSSFRVVEHKIASREN
jgi:Protein of unknown function (DUF2971)